jgi:hypothetical protein
MLWFVPVIGEFVSAAGTLSSPIYWMEAFLTTSCATSYVGKLPPRYLMTILENMRHPAFVFVRVAGPFLLYGLIVGYVVPCASGSNTTVAKSVAIRFALTFLAVALVGICVGFLVIT